MKTIRIGTWNLERSGAMRRQVLPRQLDLMQRLDADMWVLTETHESARLDGFEHRVASRLDERFQQDGESLVAIHSRHPLSRVPTDDPVFTAAAAVRLPHLPRPLLMYGTVITYAHDGVRPREDGGPPCRVWERHRAMVRSQTAEWRTLSERFPDHDLCVAGDFNMNLDGTRWYGVGDAREALEAGLLAARLRCLTKEDIRESHRDSGIERASVCHICYSDRQGMTSRLRAWSGGKGVGRLSDHNGLMVEVDVP